MSPRVAGLVLLSLSALVGCRRDAGGHPPIRVAAAADLAVAFEELARMFERDRGQPVSFSFGSTGLLAKQLREGAPFDVFAAANASFVDEVVTAGACDGATRAPYARGRIVVWTRDVGEAPKRVDELAEPRFTRIAIANPEHAPYGVAARDALIAAGVFERVRPRLVYGENVRQTLQLAETGNVEAAIVALSLVIQRKDGAWALVPDSLHKPIDQALVVCRRGASFEGGRAFAAFVNSSTGREVMRRYGFVLPGEGVVVAP